LETAIESKFGSGHYDERAELLDTCLGKLDHDADLAGILAGIYEALLEARRAHFLAERDGRALDERRRIVTEHRLVTRNLLEWTDRAVRLYESRDARDTDVFGAVIDLRRALRKEERESKQAADKRARRQAAQAPQREARPDAIREEKLRRDRGRPAKPWIRLAHRQLSEAGVKNAAIRQDLLMAVGVTPYRTPPDRSSTSTSFEE